MKYVSTRSQTDLGTFCDVLLSGLAPDGGLAMPTSIPVFSAAQLAALRGLSYPDLAYAVMRPFISDIPEADLRALLQVADVAWASVKLRPCRARRSTFGVRPARAPLQPTSPKPRSSA